MLARFAAADGENGGLKERICQLEGQIQHALEHAKSPQDANGMLAAENGLLKVGRVHAAAETRGASAQMGEPNAQLRQQRPGRFFMCPQPANGSNRREITIR
ncbi:hypothetical protein ERJ75_000757600 [Trypanosoma vivax]|nr:hypothetical protein ERJ75_000757600 [Trypanosoma vivax]